MELGISGKKAIVTGGSAGIGLACAIALCREGADTLIAARDEKRLEEAVAQIRAASETPGQNEVVAISADLTLAEDIRRVVHTAHKRFGRVDILMVREVLPRMREQKDGRIVNIIGGAARTPSPTFLPGSTANAALLNFTKGIARELIRDNIRINAISPGPTATERANRLNKQLAEAGSISEEEARRQSIEGIPLGRMVEPCEIAALTLFLVSDLAAPIVGAEIAVDGGSAPGI